MELDPTETDMSPATLPALPSASPDSKVREPLEEPEPFADAEAIVTDPVEAAALEPLKTRTEPPFPAEALPPSRTALPAAAEVMEEPPIARNEPPSPPPEEIPP